ncbi:cation:proton antiporter [Sulfobacillus thermosulfidooxidans]|uniref:cation:proton antiporter n=1 Tax=Sulfobacillus thermosulfidooxidans TaxID=28034 RepID=UPI0006B5AA5B|nr:cation:proton antiporter [Sulfobacillus thermosulfidooxidans]
MSNVILSILVVSIVALMAPWILLRTKVKIPIAAAEILLGVVFGKSGLGWIQISGPISFLSLFGLSYIMFLYGLETNLDSWLNQDHAQLQHARWLWPIIVLWIGLGFAEGFLLLTFHVIHKVIPISLLLASSAPTVLLPTLKERGLVNTNFGQWILSIGLLVDFTTLMGVTALAALDHHGAILRIFLVVLMFVPLVIAKSTSRFLHRAWFGNGQDTVTSQIGVRGVMMIITLFIALAETLGTITVLGAFLAGVVVSLIVGKDREILQDKLDALGFGYFIPFFFVTVGSNLNLRPAWQSSHVLLLTASFLLGIIVISVGISFLLARLFPRRETIAMATLLATRLSVTVAGSLILFQAHIISQSVYLAMIITSILSAVLFPPIFHRFSPQKPLPKQDIMLIGPAHWVKPIASHLAAQDYPVLTYDNGSEALASAAIHAGTVRVVALLGSAQWQKNIIWGNQLQHILNPDHVIVDVPTEAREQANAAGLIPFVAPLASMQLLETLIRSPLSGLSDANMWSSMMELEVTSPYAINVALKDLKLPEDTLVIGISRHREHLIPRGSTVLRAGDVITIVCPGPRRREIRQIFEVPPPF